MLLPPLLPPLAPRPPGGGLNSPALSRRFGGSLARCSVIYSPCPVEVADRIPPDVTADFIASNPRRCWPLVGRGLISLCRPWRIGRRLWLALLCWLDSPWTMGVVAPPVSPLYSPTSYSLRVVSSLCRPCWPFPLILHSCRWNRLIPSRLRTFVARLLWFAFDCCASWRLLCRWRRRRGSVLVYRCWCSPQCFRHQSAGPS